MKRFIGTVLLVLVVGLVAVGFYRGWFSVSSDGPATGGNKVNVNLTVDRDKMHSDAEAVKKETSELVGKATNQAPATGNAPVER